MFGRGKLPPPRPDQRDREATPRVPGGAARLLRLGGKPLTANQLNINPQTATSFYTFQAAGRLFSANLAFAVGSDAAYSAAVDQFYARISTQSGLVLCTVQLCISAPSDHDSGTGSFRGPDAGVPVAKGDQILLDVNNGLPVSGSHGAMRADCEVFFSIP